MPLDSFGQSFDHLPNTAASAATSARGKWLADSQTEGVAGHGHQNNSIKDAAPAKQGLPGLSIVGTDASAGNRKANPTSSTKWSSSNHWYSGALHVGEDLALGAANEVVDHPGRVLESAAIGVATSVAVGFLAPEVAALVGAAGAAFAGYKLYENAGKWIDAAKLVASPQGHSDAEQAQAKSSLESVGSGAVDLAAGFAGFSAGSAIRKALFAGASAAASVADPIPTTEAAPGLAPKALRAEQSLAATDATGDATGSTTAYQMLGRTPEERTTIINRLATGKIEDIKISEDRGLAKEITLAKVVDKDGHCTDVIVRKIDPTNPLDLSRIRQAQIQATVDSLTGIDSGAPESAMRQIDIDGKPQWVALQENAGKSLGANLKDWAAAAYGHANEKGMVRQEDLTLLIESHPALKESIGNGFFQTLYQGNPDLLNLSNLSIRGSQAGELSFDEPMQVPIVDAKLNWFPGQDAAQGAANPVFPAPNWGQNAAYGDATPVVRLYAGKPLCEISPLLQQRAQGIQQIFESAQGQADLLKAGLTGHEIAAATARLHYLTTKGFPPLYTMFEPEFSNISIPEFHSAVAYATSRSAPLTLTDILKRQF